MRSNLSEIDKICIPTNEPFVNPETVFSMCLPKDAYQPRALCSWDGASWEGGSQH